MNDIIKQAILDALFENAQKAKGPRAIPLGIRDLSSVVKAKVGAKTQETSLNLQSLIKSGYVDEKEIQNTFAAAKFNSKPSVKYELSRDGMSLFDKGSRFDRADRNAGINISAVGSTVVVGNQNVVKNIVREEYREGYLKLEELGKRINSLSEVSDDRKVEAQADIETIKNQLAKKAPDKGIVGTSLKGLAFAADIAAVAPYLHAAELWLRQALGI